MMSNELEDDDLYPVFERAKFLVKSEGRESGIQFYTKWLHENIDHSNEADHLELKSKVLNNRGQLKYLGVDFEGALADYTSSIQINQQLPCAYYNRGTIYYRMGKFKEAVEDMKKAYDLSPDNLEFKTGLDSSLAELTKLTF